jgi:chlorobactene glucosyltransferase
VSRLTFERVSWGLAVAQVLRLGWALLQRAALHRIPPAPASALASPSGYPAVSVVIPARNEAPVIGACLEGALGQDYPDLEVVVVDDRSEDGTGEIVRRAGARDGRVRLVEGRPLPAGWLGKAWALHQGSRAA